MIQTKVFKLGDYEKVNKFIKTVPVLADGGISFSQGNFIIFFEDGKLEASEKKAILLREVIDKKAKRVVMEAQYRTYTKRVAELKERDAKLEASRKGAENKDNRPEARVMNAVKAQLEAAENMVLSIKTEIATLESQVEGLQALVEEVDDKNSFVAQI